MLWLEIICLKFRFALHIYFRTSFNYLTSKERKTMTETAPASTDLHGNIASALPCQQLTGTSITTRTQPFGRVGTNRSGKCLQEALSLCVRAINIHKELDCIQPALQDSDNGCLYFKASYFVESWQFDEQ